MSAAAGGQGAAELGVGQGEREGRAAVGIATRPQAAAIGLDDRAADREPHPEPTRFGREERVEDAIARATRQTYAGIADMDLDAIAAARDGLHDELVIFARRGAHGIDRVAEQV